MSVNRKEAPLQGIKSPLKWHGGKHYLAAKIIELLPPRDGDRPWHLWREPFFGSGAVTFALNPEGLSEAVNDVHWGLMSFWHVLMNPELFEQFRRRVEAMPLSDELFRNSLAVVADRELNLSDPVSHAVAFFVSCRQSRQGLMRDFATPTRRLRRGMNENVSAWLSAVEGLPEVHERLKRIEIRNMHADVFIAKYDDPAAVFYCDPPYLHETRSTGGGEYQHEMSEVDHSHLLGCLARIKGRFLLSGYRSDLYDECADRLGWRRVDFAIDNKASAKKSKETKTECVWMNY